MPGDTISYEPQPAGGGGGGGGAVPIFMNNVAVSFGASRCFLDDKGTGTYTEGQTTGRRMHVAGTISKMWVDTLDESAASGACVVKIRNKGVADISGISLTVADGATHGESEGSATITGTEELIFACDAATGWGSNYFRCGFLFTPAT
mgnify:FL=1